MPVATLLFLVLLPPQLIDRTQEVHSPPAAEQQLSDEKRADIFMARKMYREAIEKYQLAIQAEPGSAPLYNKLGVAYHQLHLFPAAKRNYERAIRLDKTFSRPVNNLGTVYHAERSYKKAAKTYRKALKLSPDVASIHSNLGTAYFSRGNYKKATEEFLIALQLDPRVFEARGRSGSLLMERSVEDRAKYHFFMARAYASAGIFDRALLNLRRAFEDGYRKPRKVLEDPVFAPLLDNVEFQALVGVGPHQAAR